MDGQGLLRGRANGAFGRQAPTACGHDDGEDQRPRRQAQHEEPYCCQDRRAATGSTATATVMVAIPVSALSLAFALPIALSGQVVAAIVIGVFGATCALLEALSEQH